MSTGLHVGAPLDARLGVSPVFAQGQRSIRFGEVIIGDISVLGEKDTFTFGANAGDIIMIRAVQCSVGSLVNPFTVRIEVFDAAGMLVDQNSGSVARIGALRFPDGTFSIAISDVGNDATGRYTLFAQRVNDPGLADLIAPGGELLVFLNNCGEVDTYTFNAQAGDRLRVFMTKGDVGSINPFLELYDNEGRAVAIVPASGNPPEARIDQVLGSSGTFTLLAEDGSDKTGTYRINLFVQPAEPRMFDLPLVYVGQAPEGTRQTSFLLANTLNSTARGILEFVQPDGATPLSVTIRGVHDSLFPLSIPPGGVRILDAEIPTSLAQGYARIAADVPIRAQVIIRSLDNFGRAVFETSYSVPTPTKIMTTVVDSIGNDVDTGLVILNPSVDTAASVTLQLIDMNGQRVGSPLLLSIEPGRLSLAPNGEVARFVTTDLFSRISGINEFEGTIAISSSVGISVLTVQRIGDRLIILPVF